MPRITLTIGLFIFLAASDSLAQDQEQSKESYIERVFETRIGELPRMGWFDPTKGFLAQADVPEVFVFAPLGMPSAGRNKGTVSWNDLRQSRKVWGIVCELEEKDRLVAYDVSRETVPGRALYTTKKWPGASKPGMITIPLDNVTMADVNRLLGWPTQRALRKDSAIAVRAQSFYYSIHKLYKPETGLLSEEAIVLHAGNGRILAHELTRDLDAGQLCDGCGIPNYSSENGALYVPLNMFELPGFAYPVLLLNTSTVEGQALSLMTFTPEGKATQFRSYEYVINCR